MKVKSVKLNKNIKAHFFFPDFTDDVAIIKERKKSFGWVADPPFSILWQLLVLIIAIENLPELFVPVIAGRSYLNWNSIANTLF